MKTLAITLNNKTAVSVFTEDKMDEILSKIEQEVSSFVPDLSTNKGRKEVASLAAKVAKSKVALDSAGKILVTDWKAKAKLVDQSRKQARDFLDALKVKVRQPLTEWEAEEKRKIEAEELKKQIESDHSEALGVNELIDREAAIAEKERIIAEQEAEKQRIEAEKRLAEEQAEHERQLKLKAEREAKEKAERESHKKIEEAKRKEAEAKAEADRIKTEAIQAKEDARVEKERAVMEARRQAAREAEKKEQEISARKLEEKRKAERKAANTKHRSKINNEALDCLIENGFDKEEAKKLITVIAKGKISNITINY